MRWVLAWLILNAIFVMWRLSVVSPRTKAERQSMRQQTAPEIIDRASASAFPNVASWRWSRTVSRRLRSSAFHERDRWRAEHLYEREAMEGWRNQLPSG